MCGILGIIKQDEIVNFDNFKCINNLQSHRGPDEEGYWQSDDKLIALGHKRLSIIDLQQGRQPIVSADGKTVIVYNGEVYNYLELKKTLENKGYNFKTFSDTEVILYAYSEWGGDCVNHFRGMFAFAIVDLNKREIFLARDYLGIKPLVYYSNNNIFCFASEIRTLAGINNFDLELDLKSIDLYLWLQYIPAPRTVFTRIKKLEPGHIMVVGFDGEIKRKSGYWRPEFKPNNFRNISDWEEAFDHTLSRSVRAHTVADVTYGAYLSGGLDSSLIVKYIARLNNPQIKTFTIGFNEPEYNELEYSKIASKKFNTNHYYEIITADDYKSIFQELVRGFGEPFGDSSAVPTYYVSKLASKHVKVVLSGDGGDELFGGYNSYRVWQELKRKKFERSWHLNFIRFWLSVFIPSRFVPERHNLDAWININSYYRFVQRERLWKNEFKEFLNRKYEYFNEYKNDFGKNSLVHKAQLFDMANYLPYDIFTKIDITSMMNSLESRVPFIDKEVIEMALSVPEEININEKGEWEGKFLLKENLKSDFPQDFIYRKKQGFSVPLSQWFGEDGAMYVEPYAKLINTRSEKFREIFNLNAVYDLLCQGGHNNTYLILFLEEWLYQFENASGRINI
jgi:asparagine synthase (glutamine-hydrolysing)